MPRLFAWGANSHGQLGLTYESEMCATPHEIQDTPNNFGLSDIIQISGGGGHCLFLDRHGHLFSCGWNNKGQCGTGNTQNLARIAEIPVNSTLGDRQFKEIATGWDCSGAITNNGSLYVWGSNLYQQLGYGKDKLVHAAEPIKLNLPGQEVCKSVQFGLRHSCFVTEKCVYLVGVSKALKNLSGCELIKHNGIDFWKLMADIDHLACGQNHTVYCSHNQIYGIGDDRFGQCVATKIEGSVKSLKSGWTHNGVLTAAGQVLLWGRNKYGQIGLQPIDDLTAVIHQPTLLNCEEDIIDFHLGAEHGMAVTKYGTILTWGWNEHGNCGDGSTDNLYSPTLIDVPGKCILAASGAGFCYAIAEETD